MNKVNWYDFIYWIFKRHFIGIIFILNTGKNRLLKRVSSSFDRDQFQLRDVLKDSEITSISQPSEIIYIPTDTINNILHDKIRYNRQIITNIPKSEMNRRAVGVILNGDWDLRKTKLDNSIPFVSLREKFLNRKDWNKTVYHDGYLISLLLKKSIKGNYNSFKDFEQNYLSVDCEMIFNNIKKNGYKSQLELGGKPENEIEVCISRNGEILLADGIHRLTIAKLLNIKKIPVVVNVWHEECINKLKDQENDKILTPSKAIDSIIYR